MPGVDALTGDDLRAALVVLGERSTPANRQAAARMLREHLASPGAVRAVVDRAPTGGRAAFVRLATQGPATVEDLLGRGWWGRGTLPSPLDWLQERGLVVVSDDGLVHAVDEARDGFAALTLDLPPATAASVAPVVVEAVRCLVLVDAPAALDAALTVAAAGLRAVAPTVAVSDRSVTVVRAALRSAGIALATDAVVTADDEAPALPGTAEEAVGPRNVRSLLERALAERRQVRLQYFASSRGGAATDRVVDPWTFTDDLLRGYCHLRDGERTFAVDRVGRAVLLPTLVQVAPPA